MNASDSQQALTAPGSTDPQTRYNAPGQTALTYNVAYTNILRNMLARLSREAQLNKLNLDAYEDWSIALLHSWAIVLDVLAFYQERIINEGYLLTATERGSVLELARAIGYEFKPAVAASAHLALTVAPDADGQPQRVEISAEKLQLQPMAIQSTPTEGKLPQIFEIAKPFVARTEWNTLLPSTALTVDPKLPMIIYPDQTTIRLSGVRNDLQPDDTLLLIGDDAPIAQTATAASTTNTPQAGQQWHLRKLQTVKTEPLKGYTLITWDHERYLFQLDKKLTGELDKETQSNEPLSDALREAFDKAGYPLAKKVKRDILQAGSKWVVDENEDDTNFNRHYIIKFENQTLAVYEDIDKLTKPLYNPQFFIFRQKAQLFGYAKGAVYYAVEEAPTVKDQSKPATLNEQTNVQTQPAALGPASVKGEQAASKPTAVGGVDFNQKNNGGSVGTAPTETALVQPIEAVSQTKPIWTPRTLGLPGGETGEINALVANPQGILFAATQKDVFRLEAKAESWQPVATGLVQRNITALVFSNDDALYAGSSTGGIYRSKDNGDNWTPMSGDAVAPGATVEQNTTSGKTTFNVRFTPILPKAPVQTLATDGQKLYALVDDKPFESTDMECTSWKEITESATQPPANAPAAVTATAQNILQESIPLGKTIALVLKAIGGLQWWGMDLWDFVMKFIRTQPAATPIQALAVAKQGKQTAVFMGKENGQFRLPSKINRWWVAALILGLTIVWNFVVSGATQPIPFAMGAQGTFTVAARLTGKAPLTTTAIFTATTGTLMIDSRLAVTQPLPATVDLKGHLTVASQFVSTQTLTATAVLTATGHLTPVTVPDGRQPLSVTIRLATTGDLALTPGFLFSNTLRAQGDVTVTGKLTVAPSSVLSGTQVATATLTITATLEPASMEAGGQGAGTNWFSMIWTQVVGLVKSAIQQSTTAAQTYWQALQDQLPGPLRTALGWVYTNILQRLFQPVLAFLQAYLLQPLINQTSDLLARVTLITLAVLAIGLGWQYVDRRMSNRPTVKLGKSVHALVIQPNGRIFAGSEEGVFRSPENDQQTPLLNRIERVLLYKLFTDREMESVNEGLIPLNKGKAPDVRALAFNAAGNLLAGTEEGHVFRYIQHTGEPALFSAKNDMMTMIKELNNGTLPEQVTEEFHKNKIMLPKPAKPTVEQKGSLWSVAHEGAVYLIRKEGKALNVYLDYQWDEYDSGPVLAAVRTIVAMKDGVFIAGKPINEDKPEDQWFAAQLEQSLVDLDQVYADLETAYWQPGGSWLVMQPREEPPKVDATPQANPIGSTSPDATAVSPTKAEPKDAAKPTTRRQGDLQALFSINRVDRMPNKEFAQARQLSRLTIEGVDGMEPLPVQLSRFVRSKTDVLVQSQPLTLYDNRPVAGEQIKLDRYVAGLATDQRLVVSGKVMQVRVAKGQQGQGLTLSSEDKRIEPKKLVPDERLSVLSYQPKQATTAQPKNDEQPTVPGVGAQASTQTPLWRLKRQDGFEGSLDDAREGQLVWDLPTDEDPLVSEIVTIKQVSEGVLPTIIDLQQPLQHFYDRATVTLCANVVQATHGQTVQDEVLGDGSGMRPNEQFRLPQKPLTFLSADTPTGYTSTLKVLVQRLEWKEIASLYQLATFPSGANVTPQISQERTSIGKLDRDQRVYILRQDDDGNSYVQFGDGKKGARLPTGIEQVTAVYRIGSGEEGNVPANTINQPQTLPIAIPVVTNPVAAEGGVAPEPKEQARDKAPLRIRTLGHIVSQTDYEDFAGQFSGIGRVQLTKEYTIHGRKVLELAVTDMDGNKISKDSDLVKNLTNAIDKQRVSKIPEVQIVSNEPLYFNVKVRLLIDPDYAAQRDEIEKTIERKMRDQFSFKQREFGQGVARSELIALIHSVAGVESVEELHLWLNKDEEKTMKDLLIPELPGQMLLVNPQKAGITLTIHEASESLASDTVTAQNAAQATPGKA